MFCFNDVYRKQLLRNSGKSGYLKNIRCKFPRNIREGEYLHSCTPKKVHHERLLSSFLKLITVRKNELVIY